MIPVGTRVGRYVVTEHLGTGGMGAVYAALDERLGRKVALKAIRHERRLDAETQARFLREARLLSQLDHPNVCRIYELLQAGDEDFLVLELIRGRSLKEALRQGLEPRRRMAVALQVCSALVAAHGRNVIHRDLKPDNVLLAEDGTAKVLDFGVARSLDEELLPATLAAGEPGEPIAEDDGELRTKLGRILGTAGYMSPEQARGEPTSAAGDMYSFGLLLQELFTGEPPYERGAPLPVVVERASRGETVPFSGLDPDLTALIERLQSLAPAARPSAVDTFERLQWIRRKPARRRRNLLLGAAAAVLLAMAVATSVLAWRVSREAERANREAARAGEAADAAREVSDFLVGVFAVADPGETRGSTVTARELLDRGAERVRGLEGQPLLQARLMGSMGKAYEQLGLFAQADELLGGALRLRERHLGADHAETIDSMTQYAYLLRTRGDLDASAALLARAVESGERVLDPLDPLLATSRQRSRHRALEPGALRGSREALPPRPRHPPAGARRAARGGGEPRQPRHPAQGHRARRRGRAALSPGAAAARAGARPVAPAPRAQPQQPRRALSRAGALRRRDAALPASPRDLGEGERARAPVRRRRARSTSAPWRSSSASSTTLSATSAAPSR